MNRLLVSCAELVAGRSALPIGPRNLENRSAGMTWANFTREHLQPRPTQLQSAAVVLATSLLLADAGVAVGLHVLKRHDLVKLLALVALFPLGLAVLFSWGGLVSRVKTNRDHAELIRRLDAGEYVPWPEHPDGTGGGS